MIGAWVARFTDEELPERLTKDHLVESEIADRKVTRCGRQLAPIEDTLIVELVDSPVGNRCMRCDQGR